MKKLKSVSAGRCGKKNEAGRTQNNKKDGVKRAALELGETKNVV